MMREYLSRSSEGELPRELNEIYDQLEQTTTQEEIDTVGDILSQFADLHIKKINKSSWFKWPVTASWKRSWFDAELTICYKCPSELLYRSILFFWMLSKYGTYWVISCLKYNFIIKRLWILFWCTFNVNWMTYGILCDSVLLFLWNASKICCVFHDCALLVLENGRLSLWR